MNYSTFRIIWDEALLAARFALHSAFPQETISTVNADRSYQAYLHTGDVFGFYTSIDFRWIWDSLLSARFATTEEDMLTEILGRDDSKNIQTQPPRLRVDYTLHATIAMNQYLPMPTHSLWQRWAGLVTSSVSPMLVYDDLDSEFPLSLSMEPEIKSICSDSGQFYLAGVHLSAFRLVILPRKWDDSDRPREDEPDEQLQTLFKRLDKAVDLWHESLKELQG